MADTEDEDLLAPFLAARPQDPKAERLRAHLREDKRRGQRHLPRKAAALSRDEIVRTAIRVADAEGADAVSMRRIARELNAGTMSLYWHIVSKEELLDLMLDAVQGDRENPEPSGDWRRDMREAARAIRQTLHEHPWLMDFIGGRPPVGPKSLREPGAHAGLLRRAEPEHTHGHGHRYDARDLRHGRGAARGAGGPQPDLHPADARGA